MITEYHQLPLGLGVGVEPVYAVVEIAAAVPIMPIIIIIIM